MVSIANQRATNWLQEAKLRPTRQRLCLAEVLVGDGQDKHVTAETLFEKVQLTGYTVSLATVYNTLKTFCDAGLIQGKMELHENFVSFRFRLLNV